MRTGSRRDITRYREPERIESPMETLALERHEPWYRPPVGITEVLGIRQYFVRRGSIRTQENKVRPYGISRKG